MFAGDDGRDDEAERRDAGAELRARFRDDEVAVPTGRFGRLWRTGRSAAGVARAVLGSRDRPIDVDAIAKLTSRLGELKGIAMKAGQVVGYIDPSLPPELRELFSVLQTQAPASPWTDVEAIVRAAFGDRAQALLAGLGRTPIAVASIGQVHRGQLPDGTEVAVKVRHPGIETALRADFANASTGAVFARMFPGGGNVRDAIAEVRTAMLEECDFALEATRQQQFADWYRDHPTLVIPEPIATWCAPAVLTTTWRSGRSLDELLSSDSPQATRDRIGTALFELFVGTLYRHGAFHADPHPGNFAIRNDDRVVIYDFGCMRTFESAVVVALADLVAAVRADDPAMIDDALRALGAVPPARPRAREHVRRLLRGFFAPLLVRGPHAVGAGDMLSTELLRDKRTILKLALPSSLIFLFRLRFGLYAVLARLGAIADWGAIESHWAAQARAR
jgi:predicted unusual protein kinase regulating ubiquinone biosynthesis (AarF/ABC1/UbiB family)